MVKKCCVPNCQANYIKDKKINVFRQLKDLKEKKLWLSVILRDNIPDHKDNEVCQEHWPANYPKVIYYGKERPREYFSSYKLVRHLAWLLKLNRN